ncbi:MAG: hypothetical protein J0I06_15800 [Planctomycetes bacterium]|nr:hypothetical protein [Planctomycetota bacterium]
MKPVQCVLLFGLSFALVGCGVKTHDVSGTASFNGEPIPEGQIAFVPEKGGQGGAGTITNGQYSAKLLPGKYKVQITANKKMKLPPGEVGMEGAKEEVRQYIPDKYNTQTELKADIPAPAPLNFDLKSK